MRQVLAILLGWFLLFHVAVAHAQEPSRDQKEASVPENGDVEPF